MQNKIKYNSHIDTLQRNRWLEKSNKRLPINKWQLGRYHSQLQERKPEFSNVFFENVNKKWLSYLNCNKKYISKTKEK